ncbi:MAG: alpha-L-arabinofuranosidase C-terminal domain-containing protein, partial [Chloroflexota bacterium]
EQAGTMRDAVAVAIALEGFHHQCDVLTLANLAQIVNVLHAPVMTDGASIWLTPSYYALQLHTAHLGATAVPVDVAQGAALPGSENSAVSATALLKAGGTTVTVTNRHYDQSASVSLSAPNTRSVKAAQLLSADSPRAVNSAQQPDQVKLAALDVAANGAGQWRIELPPHSVATIQFAYRV